MLWKEKQLEVSSQHLWRLYRRHNVRYRFANWTYSRGLLVNQEQRRQFARQLSALVGGGNVVYVDEAAFNMWTRGRRTYAGPLDSIKIPLNVERGASVTVYGAVGARLQEGKLFMHGRSTNQHEFASFLRRVRGAFVGNAGETIHVVADNAAAHKTLSVRQLCRELQIELVFTPAYSPEFNCVERVWGHLKQKLQQALLLEGGQLRSQAEFECLLRRLEDGLPHETALMAAAANNRKYIRQLLAEEEA